VAKHPDVAAITIHLALTLRAQTESAPASPVQREPAPQLEHVIALLEEAVDAYVFAHQSVCHVDVETSLIHLGSACVAAGLCMSLSCCFLFLVNPMSATGQLDRAVAVWERAEVVRRSLYMRVPPPVSAGRHLFNLARLLLVRLSRTPDTPPACVLMWLWVFSVVLEAVNSLVRVREATAIRERAGEYFQHARGILVRHLGSDHADVAVCDRQTTLLIIGALTII
jgi:hypothetical protein